MKAPVILSALGALAVSACGEKAADGPRMTIAVAPLELDGVLGARYHLEVINNDDERVWEKTVTSERYGDGRGSLAYVGTCDASASPNRVVLVLEALYGKDGDPAEALPTDSYVNPGPLEKSVVCTPNADTRVDFDLVIARDASQGFFDIAVSFEDIFCSAKLDCVDQAGAPLTLLHHDGVRDTTVVVGFACTSGEGTPTWLHMNEIAVTCDGVRQALVPGPQPGNQGAMASPIFGWASYRNDEDLEPYDKCFWNTAIGLDLAAVEGTCTLTASATATTGPLADGLTDATQTYPYIAWNVPLATDGQLVCTSHPLNGVAPAGVGVTTRYTLGGPERFTYSMACDHAPTLGTAPVVCAGSVAGANGVMFTPDAKGVTLSASGSTPVSYELPAGYALTGCCADDCCAD